MSAIAGILELRAGRPVAGHVLDAMGKRLEPRAPDPGGVWREGPVGLVGRRARSAGGDPLPLANEDGSVRLVWDGEILNGEGLRRELEALGHTFRGRDAGEVVVRAYEAWGPGCVERLHGAFAFALWDASRRQLLLARDRIGVRPLYYAEGRDRLLFASAIRALLEHPDMPRALDLHAAYHYVGYGFVPGPATILRGVAKLPPGALLTVREGRVELRRYWELRFAGPPPDADLARTLRDGARAAVRAWMPATGTPGIFLSGTLESTVLLALAREAAAGPLPTFVVASDDATAADRDAARAAARHYRTDHREIPAPPPTPALLEEVAGYLDEPLADADALPLFLLCREARREVAVCLSADVAPIPGAGRDLAPAASGLERLLPRALAARLAAWRRGPGPLPGPRRILRRLLEDGGVEGRATGPGAGPAAADGGVFREAALRAEDPERLQPMRDLLGRCESAEPRDRDAFVDARLVLPDSTLVALDHLSVAHGLDVRAPLLDHALVELVARIPARLRGAGRPRRRLWRRALGGLLPPRLDGGPRPRPALPPERWLRHELRDWTIRLLNGSGLIRAHFDRDGVNWMMAEHLARRADHRATLWALVTLALWHRRFIEEA